MHDEYVFLITYQNKIKCVNRCECVHIYAKCEHEAVNRCVTEIYKNIREHEGLYKIELLYVI